MRDRLFTCFLVIMIVCPVVVILVQSVEASDLAELVPADGVLRGVEECEVDWSANPVGFMDCVNDVLDKHYMGNMTSGSRDPTWNTPTASGTASCKGGSCECEGPHGKGKACCPKNKTPSCS